MRHIYLIRKTAPTGEESFPEGAVAFDSIEAGLRWLYDRQIIDEIDPPNTSGFVSNSFRYEIISIPLTSYNS